MGKIDFTITAQEREKCRRVADAFGELYEKEDICIADAGSHGFVKLQYFEQPDRFEAAQLYNDSGRLFESLWREYHESVLLELAGKHGFPEMPYGEIEQKLSDVEQSAIRQKREEFYKKAFPTETCH